MKKIYKTLILFFSLLSSGLSYATVHTIAVQSSAFSPASVNVEIGDTVIWTFGGGTHTTTSLTIPSGANPWNSPITSGVPFFGYQVTVAGTYNYECSIHGFTGQLIATDASGIKTPYLPLNFNIYSIRKSTYNISYSLHHSSNVKITIYDITGKSARVLSYSLQPAGDYLKTFYLEDLQNGIYLFEMLVDNQRISKRLILD